MKRNKNPAVQRARRELAQLIRDHLDRGQRCDGTPKKNWTPWKAGDFAAQVQASPSSVRNWRDVDHPIPPDNIIPVLDVLFGDDPAYEGWRREMHEIWRRATGSIPTDLDQEDAGFDISEWTIRRLDHTEGLAELRLHPLRPANRPNTFYLDATVMVGIAQYDWENRTLSIGIRNVTLKIESESHQPAKGTLFGQRIHLENVEIKPGGIEFSAGKEAECIQRDLLGEEHLAIMEPTAESEESITVGLHAGRRAFLVRSVAPDSPNDIEVAPLSEEKDAVLNALIYRLKSRDAQGAVVLARSKIRKKTE